MNTLLRLAQTALVLLCLVLSAGLVLMVSLTWFAWHERPAVESGIRAGNAAIHEIAIAAKNVQSATNVWKDATPQQTSAITSAAQSVTVGMGEVSGAAKQLSHSASVLEKSSTALLKESTQAVHEQSAALLENQHQVHRNLVEIQGATVDSRQVLHDADSQITNPAIAETIQNLDESTKNAAEGLGEATKSLTDVRQVADKFRETYLRPVNIWWATVEKILGIGPPIVTAIK